MTRAAPGRPPAGFRFCSDGRCVRSSRLRLLEWVSAEAVTAILHRLIEQRMEQHCRGEYERSFLLDFQEVKHPAPLVRPGPTPSAHLRCFCEQWLELVLGWLSKVFTSEAAGAGRSGAVLKQWRCHMHQFFCRIYVNMRIEELFSIIRGERRPVGRRLGRRLGRRPTWHPG